MWLGFPVGVLTWRDHHERLTSSVTYFYNYFQVFALFRFCLCFGFLVTEDTSLVQGTGFGTEPKLSTTGSCISFFSSEHWNKKRWNWLGTYDLTYFLDEKIHRFFHQHNVFIHVVVDSKIHFIKVKNLTERRKEDWSVTQSVVFVEYYVGKWDLVNFSRFIFLTNVIWFLFTL